MNYYTEIFTIRIKYKGNITCLNIQKNCTVKDIISFYIVNILHSNIEASKFNLKLRGTKINPESTLLSYINDIKNNCVFDLIYGNIIPECFIRDANEDDNKTEDKYEDKVEIDIKFFKKNKNIFYNYNFQNLFGLLKLCLLKEIANTKEFNNLMNLPDKISNIMKILRRGKLHYNNNKDGIRQLLSREKGSNIMLFSEKVDGLISQNEINTILIPRLSYSRNDILYIYNFLGKYIEYAKLFEIEFARAKKYSLFEYSVISTAIIERENIEAFEINRLYCPFRIDRILFHGTSYNAIANILPEMFNKARICQHGKGVYFTEDLDSCWIYGSEDMNKCVENNHRNLNIPKIDSPFSFIASAIYYDKYGSKRVINGDYTPKTNEINFAYAGMDHLETIEGNLDRTKIYGTEFVINDLHQILPFMSFKLKRDEYCIIWRDPNFSPNPVYNNEYDEIFKKFLKERMKYINQMAKFNIYPCETSEEALNLIKRKKYNKIILISNIGDDYGGKKFVLKARELIGNEVIALFSAYSIKHLDWVKTFKNAFFSNDPKFYEEFLDCFYGKRYKSETYNAIMKLKAKIENHYGVNFNFDNTFLDYPVAENQKIKKYSDLTFDL